MNQARFRSTAEKRVAREAEETQRIIAGAREAGVPDHGKFCGYVVYVPTKNDFLANVIGNKGDSLRNYCCSPEYAIRYASRDQADRAAATLRHPAVVGVMFDVDSQLVVIFDACDARE